MKFAVFGTGMVGRTLAGKLSDLGHEVWMGTRDPDITRTRTETGGAGGPPFHEWHEQHSGVTLTSFAEAAEAAGMIFNATNGSASLEALRSAGPVVLDGKILVDVANPLDFSRGMPPSLTVCNTDSLGEQIQREFPNTPVVKTLNTVTAALMVDPGKVGNGQHTIFVCGNDPDAKTAVCEVLAQFGWKDILDLGDITAARGTEMYLPLWLRLWGALDTGMINIQVVR